MSTVFHRRLTRLGAQIPCMMQINIAGPPQRRQAETEARYHQFCTAKRARFHFPGVTLFRYGPQIVTGTIDFAFDLKLEEARDQSYRSVLPP
jgi:hypothetical protein